MSESFNDQTDYYELLGVTESATDAEIKKAYRKAALKWHPDKNHGNEAEATRVFQLIEHAYSILSDSQEKAWYDDHRNFNYDEQGEMVATNVDIYGLFKARAYFGFEDDGRGFYAVFGKAFSELAAEEKLSAPKFGWSNTAYPEVEKFYAFWTCFKTTRSFAFNDIYQLKDAPNAWYRREMSKENQKLRKKAEIEFVNAVRELALYARKRDPRVQKETQRQEEEKEMRRKMEEERLAEKRRRDMEVLEKLQGTQQKREYSEDSLRYLNEFNQDDDDDAPEWSCEYCGRVMDSASVFKTHCATKKHKKAAAAARRNFMNDPTLFEHTAYMFTLLGLTDNEVERIDPSVDMSNLVSPNAEKKERRARRNGSMEQLNEEEEFEEEEIEEVPKNKNNKKNKGKKNQNDDDDDDFPRNKKNKNNKKNKGKKNQREEVEEEDEEEDDEETIRKKRAQEKPLTKKERRKLKLQKQQEKKAAKEKAEAEANRPVMPKLSKQEKKLRQRMKEREKFFDYDYDDEEEEKKEEEKKEEEKPKEEEKKNEENAEEGEEKTEDAKGKKKNKKDAKPGVLRAKKGHCPPGMFMCRRCKALFPSKRKLFQHLEESGHAIAI